MGNVRVVSDIAETNYTKSKFLLVSSETERFLNIYTHYGECRQECFCVTADSAKALRDALVEIYPVSAVAASKPSTFFARKLALSDEWQVVRRSDSVDFIAKCDNEAMAKQIAKLMNDEAK